MTGRPTMVRILPQDLASGGPILTGNTRLSAVKTSMVSILTAPSLQGGLNIDAHAAVVCARARSGSSSASAYASKSSSSGTAKLPKRVGGSRSILNSGSHKLYLY